MKKLITSQFFCGKCIKTWMLLLESVRKYWLCISTKKSQREIAKCAGVSQPTVYRLIRKFQIEKNLTPNRKSNCGRKKKTTSRTDAYLLRESKFNPRKTSFQLQQDLASAVVMVDSSTVCRRLLAVGRKPRRPIKKQLLTTKMKKKHFIWAKNIMTGHANNSN